MPTIVLKDIDVGLPPQELADAADAMNTQMKRDFGPEWNVDISVRPWEKLKPELPTEWLHSIVKKPTLSGAYAYHDRNRLGLPNAFTFEGLCADNGVDWRTSATHENCEMAVDPGLHLTFELPDGRIVAGEICDQVEQTSYLIGKVPVTNFNLRANFEPPDVLTGVKFDFMGLQTSYFQNLPGGYSQVFDPSKGWTQLGQMSAYRQALHDLGISRGARRNALIMFAYRRMTEKLVVEV